MRWNFIDIEIFGREASGNLTSGLRSASVPVSKFWLPFSGYPLYLQPMAAQVLVQIADISNIARSTFGDCYCVDAANLDLDSRSFIAAELEESEGWWQYQSRGKKTGKVQWAQLKTTRDQAKIPNMRFTAIPRSDCRVTPRRFIDHGEARISPNIALDEQGVQNLHRKHHAKNNVQFLGAPSQPRHHLVHF